ncbi:hypothetical protein [Glaciimonas immobilis]|uniref:hypothetical protein n=1 Tax=Glaciimonas immobilis TaxID=728004 RepID=UPI00143AE05F|nr:hypothetical protein [Glaciimonas immobilis]KAF3999509.1 hypothetical protein HAV38_06235 [Glaciimonas immobilis]
MLSNWLTSNFTPPLNVDTRTSSQAKGTLPPLKKSSYPTMTVGGAEEKVDTGVTPSLSQKPKDPLTTDVPVVTSSGFSSTVFRVPGAHPDRSMISKIFPNALNIHVIEKYFILLSPVFG